MKSKSIENCVALWDYRKWSTLTLEDVKTHITNFKNDFNDFFQLVDIKSYGVSIDSKAFFVPRFVDKKTNLLFTLIPGGSMKLGLSIKETKLMQNLIKSSSYFIDFQELKPSYKVNLSPFLIAQYPLNEEWVKNTISINDTLFRPEFADDEKYNSCYLSSGEIEKIIDKYPHLKIPTESQWEYACRGGQEEQLFYFGDNIDKTYAEEAFGNYDFGLPNNDIYANRFGLFGLGTGEWCTDIWEDIENEFNEQNRVIKSGTSLYYPWSDNVEILMGANSFRQNSSMLEDGTCGVRFMIEL